MMEKVGCLKILSGNGIEHRGEVLGEDVGILERTEQVDDCAHDERAGQNAFKG